MQSSKQPCSCGSGKPFRKCCGRTPSPAERARSGQAPAGRTIRLPTGQVWPADRVLQEAMRLHQAGDIQAAAALYRALLAAWPEHADALHLLGVTERQQGRYGEAIRLIRRAIAAQPGTAIFHSNLSETYRTQGAGAEATAAARRALELDPRLPEAYLNLGGGLHLQRQMDAAIAAYRQALQLRPGWLDAQLGIGDAFLGTGRFPEALDVYRQIVSQTPEHAPTQTRIGIALRRDKRIDDAIAHYRACIARQPRIAEYHNNLAHLYVQTDRRAEAIECLTRLLEITPDDISARHLLDALEGRTTDRAPADYVRELFDQYADTFESHLVEKLAYRTPQLLGDIIRSCAGAETRMDILDLGCGTGLMVDVLRDNRGRNVVGVDISPKMVEVARHKGLYTALFAEDLIDFMRHGAAHSYDLVVAADVFVYIGDLQPIFSEATRLLRPSGWFAFTVEAAPAGVDDFVLDHTGRYRHLDGYLHRLARQCGFDEAHFSAAAIRTQKEQPVHGYLCVLAAHAKV